MAFIVGYVNEHQLARLEKAGYQVEDAKDYNLIGDPHDHLLYEGYSGKNKAVVIYIDCNLIDLFVPGFLQEI